MNTIKYIGPWSITHILFIVAMFLTYILMFVLNYKGKLGKHYIFITCIFVTTLISFEITKQILIPLTFKKYIYQFFPFQICTTIAFVPLISLFLHFKKKDSLTLDIYTALFGFIGGFSLMFSANAPAMQSDIAFLPVSSYIWHSFLALYSIYLVLTKKLYLVSYKKLIKPFILFFSLSLVAIVLNEVIYFSCFSNNPQLIKNDYINLFYISRHFKTEIPVLKLLQDKVRYIVFLLIYYISIFATSTLLFAGFKLINYIYKKFI